MKFIRSYVFGIIIGICIGISIGYMLSIAQELHQLGRSNDGEVLVAIATLKKLEKNEVSSASQMLRHVIAISYLDHTRKMDNWLLGRAFRNSDLVERVEKATKELPGLEQAINEEKAKKDIPRQSKSSLIPGCFRNAQTKIQICSLFTL